MFPYHPLRVPPVLGNPTYFPSFLLRHTVFTSPIDLSIRTLTPITPPTTPSPIRTRVNATDFPAKHSSHNLTSKSTHSALWNWSEISGAAYSQNGSDDSCAINNKVHINSNHTKNDAIDHDHQTNKCNYDLGIKEDYESDEDAFVDILTQDDNDVRSTFSNCFNQMNSVVINRRKKEKCEWKKNWKNFLFCSYFTCCIGTYKTTAHQLPDWDHGWFRFAHGWDNKRYKF